MKITDIDGLKAAIAEYSVCSMDDERDLRRILAIIDSFIVDEPLTVARILGVLCLADDPYYFMALTKKWLEEHGWDGLWHEDGEPHCGCSLDDFAPCGCPQPDCVAAFKHRDGNMYLEPEEGAGDA
jgi:hypothetical protein